ncbi:MAG: L,D-transpeptidase [Pseudomonadota bacterium]
MRLPVSLSPLPTSLRAVLGIAVVATVMSAASATSASAQFLWGGGKNSVDDTMTVTFPQKYSPGQIIVSFGDRRLYHVFAKGRATSYPIAVPRERSRWQGVLRVSRKAENPTWTPTPLMRKENPRLPAFVKGGDKRNPLGVRALYLGSTMYRIHGTDAPHTIGKNVSKGCVRMHNAHVLALYDKIKVGTKVTATWSKYATKTTASTPTFAFASGNKARNVFNTQR